MAVTLRKIAVRNARLPVVFCRHQDCDEGYAMLDLYDDGSFDQEYVMYGWKAAV